MEKTGSMRINLFHNAVLRYGVRGFFGLFSLSFPLHAQEANAQKKSAPEATKSAFFSVGLARVDYRNRFGEGLGFNGAPGTLVQIGYGRIEESSYWDGYMEIVSGPYSAKQGVGVKMDVYGTGLSAVYGHTLFRNSMRNALGAYGVALGLGYGDFVGRSVSSTFKKESGSSERVDELVLRVTSYHVAPSLFYAKLVPARPVGNKPELLATRIEGYVLNLGVLFPLRSEYEVSYVKYPAGAMSFLNAAGGTPVERRGAVDQYNIFFSFTMLLGV
jgi:hypothetical protein